MRVSLAVSQALPGVRPRRNTPANLESGLPRAVRPPGRFCGKLPRVGPGPRVSTAAPFLGRFAGRRVCQTLRGRGRGREARTRLGAGSVGALPASVGLGWAPFCKHPRVSPSPVQTPRLRRQSAGRPSRSCPGAERCGGSPSPSRPPWTLGRRPPRPRGQRPHFPEARAPSVGGAGREEGGGFVLRFLVGRDAHPEATPGEHPPPPGPVSAAEQRESVPVVASSPLTVHHSGDFLSPGVRGPRWGPLGAATRARRLWWGGRRRGGPRGLGHGERSKAGDRHRTTLSPPKFRLVGSHFGVG